MSGQGHTFTSDCPACDGAESGGQQQAAADALALRVLYVGSVRQAGDLIAAALADAARPGQELRARLTKLADEMRAEAFDSGVGVEAKAVSYAAADRLRAALEDPR